MLPCSAVWALAAKDSQKPKCCVHANSPKPALKASSLPLRNQYGHLFSDVFIVTCLCMLNELSLFTVQARIDPQNGLYSAEVSILSGQSWGRELHRSSRQTEHIMLLFLSRTVPVTFQLLAIYPPSSADSWLREVKRGSIVNLNLIKCGELAGKSLSAADFLCRSHSADTTVNNELQGQQSQSLAWILLFSPFSPLSFQNKLVA